MGQAIYAAAAEKSSERLFSASAQTLNPRTARFRGGNWLDPSPYGVVHRLASDGSAKGVGRTCIEWAFARCRHLRIDTHPDNIIMQQLLEKTGFKRCGIIHVLQDGAPRFAYERSAQCEEVARP